MAPPKIPLALLLGAGHKSAASGDDEDDDAPPSSSSGGKQDAMVKSAMRDFFDAIKSDDEDAGVAAWKHLCELDDIGSSSDDEDA